jgi:hypothetical protein
MSRFGSAADQRAPRRPRPLDQAGKDAYRGELKRRQFRVRPADARLRVASGSQAKFG